MDKRRGWDGNEASREERHSVPDLDEWEQYEEDGPLDLEEQLERVLDQAFPVNGLADSGKP